MGANRQISREKGKKEDIPYFTGLEKSKAESKSAPKSKVTESQVKTPKEDNHGISIVQHLVPSNTSEGNLSPEKGRASILKSELTEGGRHKIQRKSQKHFEFQH